jgi:hypothetical protein
MMRAGPIVAAMLPLAAAGAEAPPPVAVKLVVPKRLQLGKDGYRGKIEAEISNRGDRPVTVYHLESNSLVFEGDGGKLDVICHPCACMMWSEKGGADARRSFTIVLQKGEKKIVKLDDWGCSGGGWRGPPAGAYRVSFRVFPKPPVHREPPQSCCAQLRRAEHWRGAISSEPAKLLIVGKRPR